MIFFDDFSEEINLVLGDVYSFIGGLDKPISDLGISFLDRFKVSMAGFNTFLLFPYWLSEGFDIENKKDISRKLSNLDVYGIMHLRIIDDILDNPETIDRNLLLLSNICEFKMYDICFSLIGRNENFMKDLEETLIQFSNAVLYEKQRYNYKGEITEDMSNFDYELMARKAFHLRIPILSYLYLEGSNKRKRNDFLLMMEYWATSMQLFNDVLGWKDDFNSSQITYPLVKVIQYLEKESLVYKGKAEIMDIAAGFIETDILENTLNLSLKYQLMAIDSIKSYNLYYLNEFFTDASNKILLNISKFKDKRENVLKDIIN
ncbi:MAG: hypothetical protein APG12_00160 [Candidatus Methanofastidiosum methylothiophilum]|uniref:Uncharacterized protein n=1 Tax=Candidatus Methanofastidiosum methylothiophilum TaxID=1705564 RepID=A0A150J2B3_9EURY|nr:MAG: hypothetical protein APG10_00107 [Candidatus Methanofastidiosum methylthiophilus]KYC47107.1 MAG: hypothetical protein APG11_01416 [Candidatus Methanofastidiosum methylthiophilus]KYC51235.1 MAG: hypothetical protein APG12_00160 [Candidatus Methanofastidiosum methylthiophilus]